MSDTEKLKQTFARKLRYYINLYNINQTQVSEIAHVSKQSVSNWLNCKLLPRMGAIELLAEHFHILKSDLLEEKEEQTTPYFSTLEEAIRFIMQNDTVMASRGIDLSKMSEQEIMDLAQDIADYMVFIYSKHNKS